MKTSDFDYELPPELIAQEPLPARAQSRMMVLQRAAGTWEHGRVTDLPGRLAPGDLLVLNDTRVIPARLFGERPDTGGAIELLLIEPVGPAETGAGGSETGEWQCFYRGSARAREGLEFVFADGAIRAVILGIAAGGRVHVRFTTSKPLLALLDSHGVPPVPPYIKRPRGVTDITARDRERYQTVYAREPGAVAAPTAGLHLSDSLLAQLGEKGVNTAMITLHVGPGTFVPVKADNVEDHKMESERYEVPPRAAEAIQRTREQGGRVVAVGTTTVRTLESAVDPAGHVQPGSGRTRLFIRPPYDFGVVDALLTNFHLPRSTLLMMISALAGRDLVLRAYAAAVAQRYRFYSYGDCMLIL